MKVPVLVAITIFVGSIAEAEQPMTIDFSFKGTKGCAGTYPNPPIHIRHAPATTAKIAIRLVGPRDQELGGQEVTYPSNGIILAGSIRTFAPCKDGFYSYQAVAKAKNGAVLAMADMPRFFPIE
ncbi:hypothetical protein QRQ56_25260 [Bradyrhizobium sp. U531]|uniref:hypothetical protein n=1 Tax=Bradyrhizobium sp. U531 TaxID=3053458 RepID=UPI003F41EAB5